MIGRIGGPSKGATGSGPSPPSIHFRAIFPDVARIFTAKESFILAIAKRFRVLLARSSPSDYVYDIRLTKAGRDQGLVLCRNLSYEVSNTCLVYIINDTFSLLMRGDKCSF